MHFFYEKNGKLNNIYIDNKTNKPNSKLSRAFSPTNYKSTNKSHTHSLVNEDEGNTLVRLECEHVIPFDQMLFYFGCSSNKWYGIAQKIS